MVYNNSNISLFLLSPYIEIKNKDNDIIFYNYIYNTILKIENFINIVKKLKNGINEEELKELLNITYKDKKAQDIIDDLIRNGIIE